MNRKGFLSAIIALFVGSAGAVKAQGKELKCPVDGGKLEPIYYLSGTNEKGTTALYGPLFNNNQPYRCTKCGILLAK